jgi:hypothetical protein
MIALKFFKRIKYIKRQQREIRCRFFLIFISGIERFLGCQMLDICQEVNNGFVIKEKRSIFQHKYGHL